MHGHLTEGRERLGQVLKLAAANPSGQGKPVLASIMSGAGNLAQAQGDVLAARTLLEQALAIRRDLGDRRGIAGSLNNLGGVAENQGDHALARSLYQESLAINRDLGDRWGISISLLNLGVVAKNQGVYAVARSLFEESLSIWRILKDGWGSALSLGNLGDLARRDGNYALATSLFEESLALLRKVGDRRMIAISLNGLAGVARLEGKYELARSQYEQSLAINRELGDRPGVTRSLEGFAGLAAAEGQAVRAMQLAGASARLRASVGIAQSSLQKEQLRRSLQPARQALTGHASATAWAEGLAMSAERAIACALEPAEAAASPAGMPAASELEPGPLTPREREVAALIARGWSNREIANGLVITVSTAERHVANIFNKLALRSRTEVAVWAVAHSL
jgi:DNA-binding NarL/FixJ family response regulator